MSKKMQAELVSILSDLIALPSPYPPGTSVEICAYTAKRLKKAGYKVEIATHKKGVDNVVASHWKVLETTTTDLLAPALRKAEAGTGLAEALREQQVRSIRSSDPAVRHPAYWAPYVVIGDGKVSLE